MDQLTGNDVTTAPFHPEGLAEPTGLACLVVLARLHGLDLTVPQLIRDNLLSNQEVTIPQLLKCAKSAGLKAEAVHLDWNGLSHLQKALPVIVRLKQGGSMILRHVHDDAEPARVALQDPTAGEDAALVIDRQRFEDVWTGEVILVKRDYELHGNEQSFGAGFVASLILRDWRFIIDITICAIVLGGLALGPILFWRLLMSKIIQYHAFSTLYVMSSFMLILFVFEAIFYFVRNHLVLHLASRMNVKLNTFVFERLLHLPIDFFERTQVGLITQKIGYLRRIRQFLVGHLCGTVLDSTLLLFFLPIMFFFNPWVTLVVLGVCAIIGVWLLVTLPIYRRKTNALERADGDRGAFLVQSIHGMRTVKSLVLEARQMHLYDVHVARVERLQFDVGYTGNLIRSVVRPLDHLAVTGSIALAVYLAISSNDPASIPTLYVFILLTQRVVGPLVQVAASVNEWFEARQAVDSVAELVNRPAEEGRSGRGVRAPFQGHVQFSGVSFTYQGASSPALRQVSFEIPAGSSLGVVGRSGSGKTTVTRLLQRLHSSYEGLIKIDGVDVREYDVDHLRRSLGVVLQENFLFSGTIRENIAAAKTDATFDDIVRAARLAGAEEFIDKLPRGYETFIYEGSPNLSGGQRQRLAIARALVLDPRIFILDEATSALDPESEAIVSANLARIARGRSLIVVSHRLSSLAGSDRILVLDGGRIEDIGRHDELLTRCAIYRHLWDEQNRHIAKSTMKPNKPPFRGPALVS